MKIHCVIKKSVQNFSKFDVGVNLNDLNGNLSKLRISVTKDKDMNEYWNEFECVFNGTVF